MENNFHNALFGAANQNHVVNIIRDNGYSSKSSNVYSCTLASVNGTGNVIVIPEWTKQESKKYYSKQDYILAKIAEFYWRPRHSDVKTVSKYLSELQTLNSDGGFFSKRKAKKEIDYVTRWSSLLAGRTAE